MSITVSLAHLLSRGLRLQRYEALAIAQQLIARGEGMPSIDNVQLSSDGHASCISARGTPTVSDVAQLVHELLPPTEVPAPLRYALARATGAVEAPPFASLEAFSTALTRFEAGDRHGVVRALMQRLPRERSSASRAPAIIAAFPPRDAVPAPSLSPTAPAPAAAPRPPRPVAATSPPPAEPVAAPPTQPVVAAGTGPAPTRIRPVPPAGAGNPVEPTKPPRPVPHPGQGDAVEPVRAARQIPVMRPSPGERPTTAVVVPPPSAAARPGPHTAAAPPTATPPDPVRHRSAAGVIAASVVAGTLIGGAAGLWTRPSAPPNPVPVSEQQTPAVPEQQTAALPESASAEAPGNPPPTGTDVPSGAAAEQAVATGGDNVAPPPPPVGSPSSSTAVREFAGVAGGASQRAFSPAFAPDGQAMFFHTGGARDATSAIAMATAADDAPGSPRVVTVVNDGARNYHPQPSPDGRLIAFDSDRDGDRGVYVANADGTGVRRVSARGYAAAPTWSPDGKRLTYIRAESGRPQVWNLWVQRIDGAGATRVTSHPYGQTWSASWFPDNRRISYTHEDKLVVKDLVTGETRRFASPVRRRLLRTPAVSPDGKQVVFQVFRNGAWLLDVDSGGMRRILSDPAAEEFAWAPDGERIAYHSLRGGRWSIYVMAAAEWRGSTDGTP